MTDLRHDRRQMVREIIAKAWSEPEFLAKLLTHPEATLRAAGFQVPDGVNIRMHQDTESVEHGVIPPPPDPARKVWNAEDVHIVYCFTGFHHTFGSLDDDTDVKK